VFKLSLKGPQLRPSDRARLNNKSLKKREAHYEKVITGDYDMVAAKKDMKQTRTLLKELSTERRRMRQIKEDGIFSSAIFSQTSVERSPMPRSNSNTDVRMSITDKIRLAQDKMLLRQSGVLNKEIRSPILETNNESENQKYVLIY